MRFHQKRSGPATYFGMIALSPDGTRLAYAVGRGTSGPLFLRRMDQTEVTPIRATRDGQRFLITRQNEPFASQIQVVLNWTEELKAKVPAGK